MTADVASCISAMVARYEALAGRPADASTGVLLGYAAGQLAKGRCVGLRVTPSGRAIIEIYRLPEVEA